MTRTPQAVPLLFAELLEPVSVEQPCGTNLEYDPDFVLLQSAAAPKTDAQYGDFIGTPEAINWADIERRCRALLLRTRDIRLIVLLIRSRVYQSGAQGLRDGLALLWSLIERYPEQIHPVVTVDGEHDPVMRANALAGLTDHDGLLKDIRNLALSKAAGLTLQVREIEKAYAIPRAKEALNPESVERLLQELWAKHDKGAEALGHAGETAKAVNAWAIATLQPDAPDLDVLVKLLTPFSHGTASSVPDRSSGTRVSSPMEEASVPAQQALHACGADGANQPVEVTIASSPVTDVALDNLPKGISDRWSALSAIEEVRHWFEDNEPSSPISVLLRQAERMVGKRFAEVVNSIPADLLAQWDQAE